MDIETILKNERQHEGFHSIKRVNEFLPKVNNLIFAESRLKLEQIINVPIKEKVSSNVRTKLPGGYADLDAGIVDLVVTLNKKGYRTTCSCEGHLYEYTSKSWNYNYSPVWIVFEDERYLPPYPPVIEGYENEMDNPWRSKSGGWYLGKYEVFKYSYQYALWIGFTFYKREIKKRCDGNIHKEHERVLKELLSWAKKLPRRINNNTRRGE